MPCRNHPKNGIEFYCKDCKALACSKCLYFNHNGHKLCLIDESLEVLMGDLDELDRYYSKKFSEESTSDSNEKQLLATINTIEQNKNKQVKYIRQGFDEIIEALVKRKETMINDNISRYDNEKIYLAKAAQFLY